VRTAAFRFELILQYKQMYPLLPDSAKSKSARMLLSSPVIPSLHCTHVRIGRMKRGVGKIIEEIHRAPFLFYLTSNRRSYDTRA
jgi:hypothetical protein